MSNAHIVFRSPFVRLLMLSASQIALVAALAEHDAAILRDDKARGK